MDKPKVIDIQLCTIVVPVLEHPHRLYVSGAYGNKEDFEKMRGVITPHDKQQKIAFYSLKMDGGMCASTAQQIMECALQSLNKSWGEVICPSEAQIAILIGLFGYELNVTRVIPIRMKDDPVVISLETKTFSNPRGYRVIRYHDSKNQGVHNRFMLLVPFAAP